MTRPYSETFRPIGERMEAADLSPTFIGSFARYHHLLALGHSGLVPEADIDPVSELPDSADLGEEHRAIGTSALSRVVMLKLNGGLGTSMGLERARSLLVIKNGLTFLDVIARQAQRSGVPLVLMNSFATEADSRAALRRYGDLNRGLPLSFLQHKAPKITRDDLGPVSWPEDRRLEWCPPGHGDIYCALVTSGMLDGLLRAGRDIAFVSNADNLGAVVDLAILGYFQANRLPFLLEVTARTEMDRKGGHLARTRAGQLILRESAQCPAADMDAFQDIERHPYFNSNNLWVNLRALQRLMQERDNHLGLPMICNPKTVDPRRPDSTPVYQIETAMGAAIGVFPGARAITVPRGRFAPVKTTSDLFAVRSDAYVLSSDHRIVPDPRRRLPLPVVDLDPAHYRFVTDLDEHFPYGVPSLRDCLRCRVVGDFRFGRDVRFADDVDLLNLSGRTVIIASGTVVAGEHRYAPDS